MRHLAIGTDDEMRGGRHEWGPEDAEAVGDNRMPAELAAAISDCLYIYWVGQGLAAEKVASAVQEALDLICEHHDAQESWVLLPTTLKQHGCKA